MCELIEGISYLFPAVQKRVKNNVKFHFTELKLKRMFCRSYVKKPTLHCKKWRRDVASIVVWIKKTKYVNDFNISLSVTVKNICQTKVSSLYQLFFSYLRCTGLIFLHFIILLLLLLLFWKTNKIRTRFWHPKRLEYVRNNISAFTWLSLE